MDITIQNKYKKFWSNVMFKNYSSISSADKSASEILE